MYVCSQKNIHRFTYLYTTVHLHKAIKCFFLNTTGELFLVLIAVSAVSH